jgi:hypothetical protein
MSTLAYANLTNRRDLTVPTAATTGQNAAKNNWVDMLASLVPAEVLVVHAALLSITTTTVNAVTTITAPGTLYWCFWGLIALSMILYASGRAGAWNRWDLLRVCIPPLAFVAWTMIQKTTAFDAVCPSLPAATRTAIALFAAILLGIAANALSYKADQNVPASSTPPALTAPTATSSKSPSPAAPTTAASFPAPPPTGSSPTPSTSSVSPSTPS